MNHQKKPYKQDTVFIQKIQQYMKLRGFSPRTIKSYTYAIIQFFQYTQKSPRSVKGSDIQTYLELLVDTNKSASTVNCVYSALQMYFRQILKRKFFINIPRAQQPKTLPVVLSKKEVFQMIKQTKNPKHKTMIQLLYGCGLRVQELCTIHMQDMDFDRGILKVVQGKGKKDRIVPIPKSLEEVLKKQSQIKTAQDFLFSSPKKGKVHSRTVQAVVSQAAKRAAISKRVTPHTLRHTFATHLLEDGLDIRYIQTLLGHKKLETTQIYTHVANTQLQNILSPLDK